MMMILKLVKYENALVGIGQIKDPNPRINIYKKLKEIGFNLPIIISSHAIVSKKLIYWRRFNCYETSTH